MTHAPSDARRFRDTVGSYAESSAAPGLSDVREEPAHIYYD